MQRSRRALLQRRVIEKTIIGRKYLYKISVSLVILLWAFVFLLNSWISHGDGHQGVLLVLPFLFGIVYVSWIIVRTTLHRPLGRGFIIKEWIFPRCQGIIKTTLGCFGETLVLIVDTCVMITASPCPYRDRNHYCIFRMFQMFALIPILAKDCLILGCFGEFLTLSANAWCYDNCITVLLRWSRPLPHF